MYACTHVCTYVYSYVCISTHSKHSCKREPMFLCRRGKVTQPSGDVKAGILAACKATDPSWLEDSGLEGVMLVAGLCGASHATLCGPPSEAKSQDDFGRAPVREGLAMDRPSKLTAALGLEPPTAQSLRRGGWRSPRRAARAEHPALREQGRWSSRTFDPQLDAGLRLSSSRRTIVDYIGRPMQWKEAFLRRYPGKINGA